VIAIIIYDGDGNRVQATENGTLTKFVGAYYEVTGSQVTKYYMAGTSRVAMRKYQIPMNMTVEYLLSDHLGSTSLTTDNSGAKTSEIRYKPWGEVRYSWTASTSTTPSYSLADYTFTGQYSYMDDPSTSGVTEGFDLMFYNARWYDPALGRFAQADSIVPAGVQGYDRYAYVSNNPVKFTDPSGHDPVLFMILLISAFILTGDSIQPAQLPTISVPPIKPTFPPLDNNGNGIPETADPNHPAVEGGSGSNCSSENYTECFYEGRTLNINDGDLQLDREQLGQLELAIYYDLNKRDLSVKDRYKYDTPFWDHFVSPGNVCLDGKCYSRTEVNYAGQGMYSASLNEPPGGWMAIIWKSYNYYLPGFKGNPTLGLPPVPQQRKYKSPFPSQGTMFWFDEGYSAYNYLEQKLSDIK
jgi:RHS repeat-associated protein